MMAASDKDQRHEPLVEKMPGHWLLAKMGKRVLRPGGLELTERLLTDLAVTANDDVVEFAPGLGITARMTLAKMPRSYVAVERDPAAATAVQAFLAGQNQRCILGTAEATGLPDRSASVVYGEAILSMQSGAAKANIISEAARLLKPGGRYGIHELCLQPDDLDETVRTAIQREMTDDIHVGVRLLTCQEWCELLSATGLNVTKKHNAPMHLLELARLVRDEGLRRAIKFVWNVARNSVARRRVRAMRRTFRKYRQHVAAIALVCTKS